MGWGKAQEYFTHVVLDAARLSPNVYYTMLAIHEQAGAAEWIGHLVHHFWTQVMNHSQACPLQNACLPPWKSLGPRFY